MKLLSISAVFILAISTVTWAGDESAPSSSLGGASASEQVQSDSAKAKNEEAKIALGETKATQQKESEIPLKLNEQKVISSSDSMGSRMVLSLGIVILLAGGGLFLVKRYARPRPSQTQMQIKVLTQHYLGPKKSLAVVRIAGESILIGVTDHSINAIKTLSLLDDEIPDETPKQFNLSERKPLDEEMFTMTGIKDIVKDKLKDMRSI